MARAYPVIVRFDYDDSPCMQKSHNRKGSTPWNWKVPDPLQQLPSLAGPTDKPQPVNALTNGVFRLPNNDDKRACNLELLADGAYASRDNMKSCSDNRIRTTIPLQLNSTKGKATHGDLQSWRKPGIAHFPPF